MHLMIDFETLDTAPSTCVVSLGAVLFKKSSGIIASRYWEFNVQDQIKHGRTISEDTLRWWFTQSEGAREPMTMNRDTVYLEQGIAELMEFCELHLEKDSNNWAGLNVWGNGACFDPPILDSMFRDVGVDIPYKFWNIICYRTFDKLTKCRDMVKRQGTHHNAEDDAIYQAETVLAYFQRKK